MVTFRPASALPRGGGRKGTFPQRRASRLSWTPPPASSAVRARVSHTARRAHTPARTCVWGGRCPLRVSQLLLSCHFDLGDTTPAPTSSAHSGSTCKDRLCACPQTRGSAESGLRLEMRPVVWGLTRRLQPSPPHPPRSKARPPFPPRTAACLSPSLSHRDSYAPLRRDTVERPRLQGTLLRDTISIRCSPRWWLTPSQTARGRPRSRRGSPEPRAWTDRTWPRLLPGN